MKNNQINDKEILKTFGSNVRIIRNNLQISQEELAFKADINTSFLSDIENGKRNVSIISIIKISLALNVDVIKLFEGI